MGTTSMADMSSSLFFFLAKMQRLSPTFATIK
jgi:hypothetical protein